MSPKYADLGDFDESHRIALVLEAVNKGQTVAFVTDDEPGKPERYIQKLKAKCPGLVVEKICGPVKGVVSVIVKKAS